MRPYLILLLLTGCADYVTTYYKTGATQASFQRDTYECKREAAPAADPYRALDLINQCMAARGYASRLERR